MAAWLFFPLAAQTQDDGTSTLYLPIIAPGGAIIRVTTTADEMRKDGDCALREAIEAANTDLAYDACPAGLGFDTIVLPAGEYRLTRMGANDNRNVTGDLDIRASVRIEGAGPAATIIDGNAADRVLDIHPGVSVQITGVAIRNGVARLSTNYTLYGGCGGGGILNGGELVMRNAAVYENSTVNGASRDPNICSDGANGGGICNGVDASATIFDTLLYQNTTGDGGSGCVYREGSGGLGGGIYNGGAMTLTGITAYYNATGRGFPGGSGGNGGAIFNIGALAMVSSTIHSNRSGDGASAPERGFLGGAGSGAGIFNSGLMRLDASSIYDNYTGTDATANGSGGEGGGIANRGTLTMTNSTVSRNLAQENGGGGIFSSIALFVDSSTIASNTAETGGGGLQVISGTVANVQNTIVSDNRAKVQGPDCAGALTSFGHNLFGTIAGCTIDGAAAEDRYDQPALLLPLADNGGPTWTHRFAPTSPALDAGECLTAMGTTVAADQRGVPRPFGAACDIGAVEHTATD
jgi:CSLREA domain-containing protein